MQNLTVAQLIAILQKCNPEAVVRLAQPNYQWPFEYSIEAVEEVGTSEGPVVYIAEGSQLGRIHSEALDALGWNRSR